MFTFNSIDIEKSLRKKRVVFRDNSYKKKLKKLAILYSIICLVCIIVTLLMDDKPPVKILSMALFAVIFLLAVFKYLELELEEIHDSGTAKENFDKIKSFIIRDRDWMLIDDKDSRGIIAFAKDTPIITVEFIIFFDGNTTRCAILDVCRYDDSVLFPLPFLNIKRQLKRALEK